MRLSAGTWNSQTASRVFIRTGWICLFSALTGLAAHIRIPLPFTPVPVTLQTAAVLASGIVLGRDALYAQLLYLLLGGVGWPMFAGGYGNPLYLFGATGGYLLGFVAAAAIAGRWLHPMWSRLSCFERAWRLGLLCAFIYVPGLLQLKLVTGLPAAQVLGMGLVPFLAGDVLKVLAVSGIPSRILRRT